MPAHGATYYVTTSGSDANAGTEAQPWRTIQKAAVTLVAGDTVYIKAGTYNEKVFPKNSGIPGNYITYAAYPGDIVTLDGTGITPDWHDALFTIEGKSYIKISGLRLINSLSPYGSEGVYLKEGMRQDHIMIEKNYFHNIYGPAVCAYSCENLIIDNNEITEVNVDESSGEAISVYDIHTFEFKNNHIYRTYKEGIDVQASSNGKIYNNYIHNVSRIGIYLDAWDGPDHDIDIYQNVVHDNGGDGISMAIEQEGGSLKDISIYNNIVYNNGYSGIAVSSYFFSTPRENIKVINNICYNNGHDGIFVGDVPVENSVIRNNICVKNQGYQIASHSPSVLTIDNNLIDGSTQIYGHDAVIADPGFVNPSKANFHLRQDSPAIDAGSAVDVPSDDFDGNPRPQGAGYDIGAFEFMGTGVNGPSNGK
jgi:parallel beta-helix repeat protein